MVNQRLRNVLNSHTVKTLRKEISNANHRVSGGTSRLNKQQLILHMVKIPGLYKHMRMRKRVVKKRVVKTRTYNIKRVQGPEVMYPIKRVPAPEVMYPIRYNKAGVDKFGTRYTNTGQIWRKTGQADREGLASFGLGLSGGEINRRRLLMALQNSM